jgi:hypothetical protein
LAGLFWAQEIRMRFKTTALTLSLLTLCASAPVWAADAAPARHNSAVAQACQQDVQTLCPDAKVGDLSLKRCMKRHHEQLSEGCKTALAERRVQHPRKAAGAASAAAPMPMSAPVSAPGTPPPPAPLK